MENIFEKILDDISKITDEEFQAELNKYTNSDIVVALRDMEGVLHTAIPFDSTYDC